MQVEALMNLAQLRKQSESRAIIVSATGTGKTYLSAFDVRQVKPNRMLYIAQQEQILKKAEESFQKVLGCPKSELGLFSGGSKESDRKYVFATVQTMSRPETLAQFDADEFDYILVDEVHHAAAESYKRVIDHFQPNFMLGMTATPERTDGANIFELFGNNVAYEIRLQKALEEDMLCPFHYYGVHEYIQDAPDEKIDGKDVKVESMTDQERNELSRWLEELADPNRVRYIIDKIQIYSEAGTPVQGLVFCSRREEAKRLSDLFNQQMNQQAERPYRTKAITGENSQMERDTAVAQLENGELDYIFTVDLFNEGVDIPHVNQIVMLRQTKSSIIFTQQLGRGLRKGKRQGLRGRHRFHRKLREQLSDSDRPVWQYRRSRCGTQESATRNHWYLFHQLRQNLSRARACIVGYRRFVEHETVEPAISADALRIGTHPDADGFRATRCFACVHYGFEE